MPAKRQGLAARRKAAGFSQEQLAERLRIDRSTVARWESGETEPQPWIRPRLARVLEVSLDQLDRLLAAGRQAEAGAEERVSHALTHPGSTDLVTVAGLRSQVQHLDEQYVHVPSSSLLARAGQCLGQVRFLAAHATSSRIRRELHAVEAEAAILMGQLVWDASQRRDHASARMYLDQAIDAARQVRDPAAAHSDHSKPPAIVLGNLALALIRQGDLDEAAGRLHEAIDVIELNRGGGGLNIAFTAGREMRPWRTVPAVQDVYDRLLTLMAG
jgi:transcriptional regulator with XRE-family HTH domain